MSRQEREKIASDNLRSFFNPMMKRHIGCVSINTHNKIEHERRKFELAYQLKSEGNIIATELVTKKNLRPDLVILDVSPPICYEIVNTETIESMKNKKVNYHPL